MGISCAIVQIRTVYQEIATPSARNDGGSRRAIRESPLQGCRKFQVSSVIAKPVRAVAIRFLSVPNGDGRCFAPLRMRIATSLRSSQ